MNNLVLALLVLSGHIPPSILLGIAPVHASCGWRTCLPLRRDCLPLFTAMHVREPQVASMTIQSHDFFAFVCTKLHIALASASSRDITP